VKKGKILSTNDESYETVKERVTIMRDENPLCPYLDYDQIFEIWSNIPREMCGSKDAYEPLEEILDEDGCGTGRWKAMDGHYVFPVSAYIHSGISLSMGTVREFPCDPGGWDTTPNALLMYTTKERYEKMCGKWKERYNEETKSYEKVEDEKEWREYLYERAKAELDSINLYLEGVCFGYRYEKARRWREVYERTTTYEDGKSEHVGPETTEGVDWEEVDSCWGYLTDDGNDIDFPKSADIPVYADDSCDGLVGDEYDIPEYVVTIPPATANGVSVDRYYLSGYSVGENDNDTTQYWTHDKDKALKFESWWEVQNVAQKVIKAEEYNARKNCVEIDSIKEGE